MRNPEAVNHGRILPGVGARRFERRPQGQSLTTAVSRSSIILVATLLLSLQAPQARPCDRALADSYEQKARDAGRSHESRVQYFRNAIDVCPKTPSTYVELVETLLALERIAEAESTVRQGLKFGERHSGIRRVFGDVLRKNLQYDDALGQYELAVRYAAIPRDRFYALAHKGWAHHGLGQHTDSTKSWEDALAIGIVFDPVTNRRLHNMVAWNHAVCRTEYACSAAKAVDAYKRNPARRKTWYELGTGAAAFARAGDFESAVRLQEQSIALLDEADAADKGSRMEGARQRLALYRQARPYTEQ